MKTETRTEPEREPMRSPKEIGQQWGMKEAFVVSRCRGRHGVKKCGRVWRIPQSVADQVWKEFTPPEQYQTVRYDVKRVNGVMTRVLRERKA